MPDPTIAPATRSTPQAADAVEVAERLRLSITRLARILRQEGSPGLAPTLSVALATVEREGPLTLGRLATREHVAPPTITRVVDRLEQMGLVERRQDGDDRRVSRVQVTAAGRRHVAKNRSARTAWLATRLQDLSREDVECLHAATGVLERMLERAAGERL